MDAAPRTFEQVFQDFKARRRGIIKALTTDVRTFYQQCDPEKENLCLFGLPNGSWEVNPPIEEVPPELPEAALGINFARDLMREKDWLTLVAVHSDVWLLSVAFYFGAHIRFGKTERRRLFQMINDLPTVFEVLTGTGQQPKEQSSGHNNSKQRSSGKPPRPSPFQSRGKPAMVSAPKEENENGKEAEAEDEDDQGGTLCGACGNKYGPDEFWIFCDICEGWFHGNCVEITPAQAEHIKQYKCPGCSNKRARV